MAAVKLAGFLMLLGVIFACAYVIGGQTGPVTTGHSPAQYTGGTGAATTGQSPARGSGEMPGMDMGTQP